MDTMKVIIMGALFGIASWQMSVWALDNRIDRDNRSICDQARHKGEENTQFKCGNYYRTGNIKYLRGVFNG